MLLLASPDLHRRLRGEGDLRPMPGIFPLELLTDHWHVILNEVDRLQDQPKLLIVYNKLRTSYILKMKYPS